MRRAQSQGDLAGREPVKAWVQEAFPTGALGWGPAARGGGRASDLQLLTYRQGDQHSLYGTKTCPEMGTCSTKAGTVPGKLGR